jgi:branched-chain amino acid transport system permease protein
MLTLEGVPVPAALLGAAAAGGAVSALIFAVFGRLEGFFFGLSTLAAGEIIRLLLRNLEQWTNGVRGLAGYPPLSDSAATSFWILLATVAILLAGMALAIRSPIGLVWRAIRENSMKAASGGIQVHLQKLLAFTLSGAIIALGGAYFGLLAQFIDPAVSDLKMLVQAVLMVALGGLGTVLGPVVGAAAITLLPEMLRVTNELRLIAYGVALILVVLLLPRGVVGTLVERKRARRVRNRRI